MQPAAGFTGIKPEAAPSATAAPSTTGKTAGNLTAMLAEGSQNNVDQLLKPTTATSGKPGFDDHIKSVRATTDAIRGGGTFGDNKNYDRSVDLATYRDPTMSAASRADALGRLNGKNTPYGTFTRFVSENVGGQPNQAPKGGGVATPNLPNPVEAPAQVGRDTRFNNFKNAPAGLKARSLPGMQPGTTVFATTPPKPVKAPPITQAVALRTTKLSKPQFPIRP